MGNNNANSNYYNKLRRTKSLTRGARQRSRSVERSIYSSAEAYNTLKRMRKERANLVKSRNIGGTPLPQKPKTWLNWCGARNCFRKTRKNNT
jgi:hypothetical protein